MYDLIKIFKRIYHTTSILAVVSAMLLIGCNSSNSDNNKSFSLETQTQFQNILEEKRAETGAAGTVLLVRDDEGRQWTGSYGISQSFTPTVAPDSNGNYNWEGTPLDENLVFRVGRKYRGQKIPGSGLQKIPGSGLNI